MRVPVLTPEQAQRKAREHGWGTMLALEGVLAEWDKFSRYGSPIAHTANDRIEYARHMLAKARGEQS